MKVISRTVWVLSLVSFFTDISSEMLYPVMPLYLKSIGFSVVLIGVLEGFAEATAGLSKGYFGKLSDVQGKRLPFVQLGYALSAISKPMMAVLTWPWWIFSARTIDRLGKGVRTGARDALLAGEAPGRSRGEVFGFHRTMDTFGAALGPTLALVFLYLNPGSYHMLFYLAFIPGVAGVLGTLAIKEKKINIVRKKAVSFFSFIRYLPTSSAAYKKLLSGLLVFTLFNSSDVFLLLMLKHHGISDTMLIGMYIFYNLIFAVFAYPLGKVADNIGLKKMFIAGLAFFSIVYFGMAYFKDQEMFFVLFFLYGVYAACTEGVSKAWISNTCKKEDMATAIGTYEAFRSIATLLASSLAGLIWFYVSPKATFITTAVAVSLLIIYFINIEEVHSSADHT
ncbi:hypothetical protein C900_03532 [Fulvivirga imtechensis AK7]|uniref:Major facilitator superfamily (MFS) profile domain-containing protein n=1 Tax=Fulvivirga imtechensis AK7 TaxID=1237149 RepID=L8JNK8_9BACT|nr:MFS transporter [Fulvivirga imtechensis]ELR70551.1 hypothetical protein C900_03532 [Fulvivirga imtechensis AK7]